MARTKTWREKATYKAITTKINRRHNPVTSYAKLAEEFGAPVSYGGWYTTGGPAASSSFRTHVKTTLGESRVFS